MQNSLVLKVIAPQSWRLAAPLLSVGDLVMARRQLLNFKLLAEAWRTSVMDIP